MASVAVLLALLVLAGVANVASTVVFPRLAGPGPGAMHVGFGLAGIGSLTLAYLVLARPLQSLGRGFAALSIATAIAIPALFVGPLPLNLENPGLYHRIGQAFGYAWGVAVAAAILREQAGS